MPRGKLMMGHHPPPTTRHDLWVYLGARENLFLEDWWFGCEESQVAGLVGIAVRECGGHGDPIVVCSLAVGLRCKESPGVGLVGCGP